MMEYDYAVKKKIPVILFVKLGSDGEPVVFEKSERRKMLYRNFLDEVQSGRIRKGFTSKYELPGFVFQALDEEVRVHPRYGWKREYDPEFTSKKTLLLRGRLYFYHLFDMAIYQVKDKFIELGKLLGCDGNYIIKYGIDTQGTFKLVFFNGKAVAYNLYNDVPAEFFDKETDMLRSNTKMQISLAKMGNQDDMLMFFCVGDGCYLFTKIYRISADDIKFISTVCGQEYMFVDYSLTVPYGSQGLYETYLYCDREILHVVE